MIAALIITIDKYFAGNDSNSSMGFALLKYPVCVYMKKWLLRVSFFMVHRVFQLFYFEQTRNWLFFFFKKKNATKSWMSETRVKFSHLITVEGFWKRLHLYLVLSIFSSLLRWHVFVNLVAFISN